MLDKHILKLDALQVLVIDEVAKINISLFDVVSFFTNQSIC